MIDLDMHSMIRCVQLSVTTWTVSSQAPLSMEFSRQEDWSGLPLPPPGNFDPGIEQMSPALAGRFFPTVPRDMGGCIKGRKE